MTTIHINGHEVSPGSQQPGGIYFSEDASQSNYILIHCAEPLAPAQAEEIRGLGAQVLSYVGEDTYSCRYQPSDLTKIRDLPFVVWANIFPVNLAISPALHQKFSAAPDDRTELPRDAQGTISSSTDKAEQSHAFHIALHHEDQATATIQALLSHGLADPGSIVSEGHGLIRVRLKARELEDVAKLDDVATIHEIGHFELLNDQATIILDPDNDPFGAFVDGGSIATEGPDTDEDAFGDFVGASASNESVTRARGAGQLIVVADTGLDTGHKDTMHEAFKGRVYEMRPFRSDTAIVTAQDDEGHGTHVAGSIMGSGGSLGFGLIEGTAPEAHVIAQACATGGKVDYLGDNVKLEGLFTYYLQGGKLPSDPEKADSPLILRPRVHNNSWGQRFAEEAGQIAYDGLSKVLDGLVRDNQDWIFVFGAGNSGHAKPLSNQKGQLGSPAGAKNVITVGACENTHPFSTVPKAVGYDYKYDPGSLPARGNPNNVAAFSSRGPTIEDRIKPDVVAPGVLVYSARSQQPNLSGVKEEKDGVITYNYDKFGVSPDPKWWFMRGTSMAAPLVSGCCAVLREAYCKKYAIYPSAAMVKALLVNGADDMSTSDRYFTGTSHGGPAPNGTQGWGRVNMKNSLRPLNESDGGCYDSRKFSADDYSILPTVSEALGMGGTKKIEIEVKTPGSTLVATLAYPDVPMSGLVNLVSFTAVTPDNFFPTSPDPNPVKSTIANKQNVRRLTVTIKTPGKCVVTIKCERALQDDKKEYSTQDFAFCWDIRPPPPAPPAPPAPLNPVLPPLHT